MKEHVCIPALRLPDGTLFQGEPHAILLLRVIEAGLSLDDAVGGNIDRRGIFCPVYEPPEDVLRFKILTKEYGIELAESGSHRMRWAVGKLVDTGREDQEGLEAYIKRFDSLCNIGIIPAIRNFETGEIFAGVEMHGELSARHPELSFSAKDISEDSMPPTKSEVGWSTIDAKQFLTRDQAREYSVSVTGVSTSNRLISGEEWFSKLETERDAKHLAGNWHRHGFSHAKSRLNIFKRKGIHPEYTKLLKLAIDLHTEMRKK